MALPRWLVPAVLVALVGCQAPAAATPTPALVVPSRAPATLTPAALPTAAAPSTSVAPPASASRIDTLNAANAAFSSGDLKAAAGLYDRVVNSPPNPSEAAAASTAIDEFARFRGMVAWLGMGREDEARIALDELEKRDPNAPFARLGAQLYDQYGMTGQLRGACAQLQPQVASQAGPILTTLRSLGVALDPATLCSVP